MIKYGILSLNIYEKDNNWGSILQSYALQECIKSLGYDVQIVDICPKCINKYEAKYPIVRIFPFNIRVLARSIRNSILNASIYIRRAEKFEQFINKFYNKTSALTYITLKNEDFHGYIVGSDIIWNIDFTNGFDDIYFCNLGFMKELNNIAYAPSMSDRQFNKEEEKEFIEKIKNFKYLSVREKSVALYVQQYTPKDVPSVLDPTLLLSEIDYDKFLLPRLIEKDYVLVYTVPDDEALAQYASEYAEKNGLLLIRIECLNIKKKKYKCIEYSDAGIEEWLTLIKYANKVFTNSFHACIFSIIFKTQFHVVYRNPGKTKIEDLCKELGIYNYNEKVKKYTFDIEKKIDFCDVYKKLSKKKEASLKYLEDALAERR